jgi:hypothetical protein
MLFQYRFAARQAFGKIKLAASRESGEPSSSNVQGLLGVHGPLASQGDTCDFTPAPQSHPRPLGTCATTHDKGHPVHLISTRQKRMGKTDHIIERPNLTLVCVAREHEARACLRSRFYVPGGV